MLGLMVVFAFALAAPDGVVTTFTAGVVSAAAQQPEPQSAPPPEQAAPPAAQPSAQPQQPAQRDQIDVNVNQQPGSGDAWYRSPLWIAIGSIAIILFAVVVIMMVRGGTTEPTIIRNER